MAKQSSIDVLYDLEGSGTDFTALANLWTVSSLRNSNKRVYTCAGNDLLGGYNIMGGSRGQYLERTYTDLPAHNQIHLTFTLYALDSWDESTDDHFNVKIGDTEVTGWTLDFQESAKSKLCGDSDWKDIPPFQVNFQVPNEGAKGSSVTLRITNMCDDDSSDESLGIRDVILSFETVGSPSQELCGVSSNYAVPDGVIFCPCDSESQYMDPANSGTCHDCDGSCKTCSGPNSNQCLSCVDGKYLSGSSSKTCAACHSSCATCDGPLETDCLTCNTEDYFVDGSCVTYCNEPFYSEVVGANNVCKTPCPGQFAWKDDSCTDTCSSPYSSVIVKSLKACVCFNEVADGQDCYACDSSCSTCDGQQATQCLTCFDRFYLAIIDDDVDGTCESCDSSCLTCSGPSDHECLSCDPGYYLFNGTCTTCHPSCLTCDGPSSTECLTCESHFYLTAQNSCDPCDDSCLECSGPSENQCKTCSNPNYLYNNNTCVVSCNSPFFVTQDATNKYCDTPCPTSYAMEDGNCVSGCDALSESYTLYNLKACYCNRPNYRYWNHSCLATCDFPLKTRTSGSYNYCDFPCAANEYLYFDGSCSKQCPAPYVPRVIANNLYCTDLGCKGMKINFIKATVTGFQYTLRLVPDTCDLPEYYVDDMINQDKNAKALLGDYHFDVTKTAAATYFLDLALEQSVLEDTTLNLNFTGLSGKLIVYQKFKAGSFVQQLAKMADAASSGVTFATAVTFVSVVVFKSASSVWGFVGFQQLMNYYKYINIQYPFQIEMLFKLGGATDFGSLPNLLDMATNSTYKTLSTNEDLMTRLDPPRKFVNYEEESFFIKEGGSLFLLNMLLLVLLYICHIIKKTKIGQHKHFLKVDGTLRWNFTLRSFLAASLPFLVAIFLQLRISSAHQSYVAMSTSLAVFALLYCVLISVFMIQILRQKNFKELKEEKFDKVYGTLVDKLNIEKESGKYYYLIVFLRNILFAFVIVFVEKVPLLQILSLAFFNIGFAYYIRKNVRFEDPKETRKTIITETMLVPMDFVMCFLTRKPASEEYYEVVGWIISAVVAIIFLNEMYFVILIQIETIKQLYQKLKPKLDELRAKRRKKKSDC